MQRPTDVAGAALGVESGRLVEGAVVHAEDAAQAWPGAVDRLQPLEQCSRHLRRRRRAGLEESSEGGGAETSDLGAPPVRVLLVVGHGISSVPQSRTDEDACFSAPTLALSAGMTLSTREREVLDLEREWWRSGSTKQVAIRDRLGCSPGAYYAALRRLVASEEAFRYDPLVVQRVRRRQERERRARVAGVTGPVRHHRR